MKPDQLFIDKINGVLSDEFEVEIQRMQPESNIRQVLELDSLDYIDLVVVIENNFFFKVNPEDFLPIISFSDFYSYIISHVQVKEPTNVILAGQVQGQ
jgi:acyl carrier protein